MDSVFHVGDVKIQEKSKLVLAELEIGENLRAVNVRDACDRLEFNDDRVVDQ